MYKDIDNLNKTYADIAKNKTVDLELLRSKVEELESSLNKISNELRSLYSQIHKSKKIKMTNIFEK